ncbi:MAG: NYN domain-containing protein [Thermoguttaceae bacterium]
MPLLIDGYNVLHETGILGRQTGPGSLERARLALLNFLAESLSSPEISRTTVVFDSRDAPWGAASKLNHRGIKVLFASRYPDADCLIEELILKDSTPKRLTVVSSDHRLQRAARRRKAKAVDSDVWYKEVVKNRLMRQKAATEESQRPPTPLLAEDVEYWVRQFGGEAELDRWMKQEISGGESDARKKSNPKKGTIKDDQLLDLSNPFAPGYAEDVRE